MLKGDLTSTPLAPLLRDLAADTSTGCLHVTNAGGEEALIYMKNGLVYSVSVPGTRPQLGAKLVSSGALAPEALAEALEAQRSELQGWRLGELLVHLGYVDQPVVEAFISEQVTEALWDLLRWTEGRWKFRKNIRAREDIGPPMVVVELLATLRDRGYEWENISAVVHGPAAVPVLSARGGGSPETTLDNDAWSMLCKIDGERSVADLARDCGYTLFEAGQIMVSLVQAGLVDIDEDIDLAGSELYGATTLSSAFAGALGDDSDDVSADDESSDRNLPSHPTEAEKEDVLARLARLVNEVAGDHAQENDTNGDHPAGSDDDKPGDGGSGESPASMPAVALAPRLQSGVTSFDNPMIVPLHRHSSESFAASIARVSNALSDVLGDTPDATESESSTSSKPVALKRSRSSTSDPEWQRRKRLRSAAAAELASAQAMVETLRSDHDTSDTHDVADVTADAVTIDDEQLEPAGSVDAAAEQTETEDVTEDVTEDEAERLAAEQAEAEQADTEPVAAEQAEAERVAAEQEATEQAEAERLAAEEADRVAVAAAELAATEELAWADYWQRDGEERAATEQAEAERLAAEQAEADRIAAELAEAERIEAERVAAEEAERVAAEQAETERIAAEQAEAERVAAEEAERVAAEQAEAERVAAEEAERVAAEQAETERIAAEHAEAEAEAERLAAEQAEAERVAAEEAERLAAEQAETERLAAEQAAQEAAEREAAEQAETERLAAEEAERLAAEELAQQTAAQAENDRLAADAEHLESEAALDAASTKEERAARRKAEKQAAEDEARQADEAAAATALLVELAATSQPADEPEPDVATVEEESADSESGNEPQDVEAPWTEAGQADTAALLRELSSLGMDDDEPSAPTASTQRPRPTPVDKKSKKKIGLFGL